MSGTGEAGGAPKVSARARFERFPATVKGAFVLRGEDRDPHQVVLREARAVGVAGQAGRPISMASATLDVAPRRDLFVPFELQVADLEPGWYGLECDLDVDGVAETFQGGKLFAVAWPRATVRRGHVRVDREVKVGAARVVVEQIECGGDSIKVHLVTAEVPTTKLSAGGRKLEVLSTEHDESSGRTKVTAYPLMKSDDSVRIEFKAAGRGAGATLDVQLP